MRVVIQRVKRAAVSSDGKQISAIGPGLLIFIGIELADNLDDIEWLCNKIVNLSIFNDNDGIMNLSVRQTNGEILVVSQFTLHALVKKGNRPSYIRAAGHEIAIPLYNKFVDKLSQCLEKEVQTGIFGSMMDVELTNDGPVTFIIDTKNKDF